MQPAKQWDVYQLWVERVMAEFTAQGDRERELGIPVTPIFDRLNPIPLPKLQVRDGAGHLSSHRGCGVVWCGVVWCAACVFDVFGLLCVCVCVCVFSCRLLWFVSQPPSQQSHTGSSS